MFITKKIIFLMFTLLFFTVSNIFASSGGHGGGGGSSVGEGDGGDGRGMIQGLSRLFEGIKNGTIAFIPKVDLEAREKRKVEIRKMQAKNEKEAGLMIKAGNLMDTGHKIANGTVIGGGLILGAIALPGAALGTAAVGAGGYALTAAGATAVGLGYSAATGYASGGSGTKSALQSGTIDVLFPKSHALTKAAIDYIASNANTKSIKTPTKNINIYNSSAYHNARATHSTPSYGSYMGGR